MTIDVGLLLACGLLAVLVAGLVRGQADLARRVDGLERARARRAREPVPKAAAHTANHDDQRVTPVVADTDDGPVGDGVDVTGLAPDGESVTLGLEHVTVPTLLAFLSTSCGICTSIWERLRDGALMAEEPAMQCVVVAKDPDREDVHRVRQLSPTDGSARVVMSSEAWDDYEVPGSPYLLLLTGSPATILAESAVSSWDDVVALVRRAAS